MEGLKAGQVLQTQTGQERRSRGVISLVFQLPFGALQQNPGLRQKPLFLKKSKEFECLTIALIYHIYFL